MESNELNLNSSNLRPQPRITNQSGHNSGSPSPMVAQILAATQSIMAMKQTSPSLCSSSPDISFGRHFNTVPIISKQRIQQKVLSRLEELNKDPDVLYMSELRQRPDAEQINRTITEKVEKYGFKRPSDVEYVYTGSDPACALRNLLSVRPLVLDCATAPHLLTYQALLESLYRVDFNTYIEKACGGVLSINKQIPPPLPTNRTAYYSTLNEENENPLPEALKMGDHLWIQGPANGYSFHPANENNAFNVLVDTNDSGQPSLIGFVSTASPTHGRWSYAELRNLLLKSYNSPLTLRDIQILHAESKKKIQETVPYSGLSYKEAYAWLRETQPAALLDALKLLGSSKEDVDLDQKTRLRPPPSNSIRGVVQHNSLHDSLSFYRLTHGEFEDNLSTIARNPVIPPNKQFSDLIPGFKTDLPHQQQIHAAIDDFYHRCVDKNGQKKEGQNFDGLILYGNSGTGKTMACKALVDQLKKKKHVIWKTDFSGGESLLSTKEQTQLLSLRQTKGTKAYYAALTEKFKAVWKRADIIFIDDTNKPYGVLANISKVAIDYAREMGKKILITCNSDPICAFHSHIKYPIDAIVIRHITGSDYREGNAWYQGVEPKHYPVPERINNFAPTENQKQIHQWLQTLQANPGHNGVAFYGAPGMGKTTVLKDYFSTQALKTLWIESHTLIDDVNLQHKLAASDTEYLVIDDCNDPKGNYRYQKVLFDLLNTETLLNKNGQPVKVILVSNRQSQQDLVGDTISGNELLSPRMKSRYAGRFTSVELIPGEDFRANGIKRGVITTPGTVTVSSEAYQLSITDYLEKHSEYIRKYDMVSAKVGQTLRAFQDLAEKAHQDSAWQAFQDFRKNTLQNITNCPEIFVDMTKCGDSYDPRCRFLITQILDVMEAKPDYKVTIVSEEPQKTMSMLKKMMAEVDKTDKYLSRLQRLAVQ